MTAWRRRISRGFLSGVVLLAAAIGPVAGTALAQQVTLKLHHFVPAQSNQQKFWFEPWAKKLEQESGGRLKVEIYPSMQLGGKQPQLYDQAKDGVVDIVWTVSGTHPGVSRGSRCSSCRSVARDRRKDRARGLGVLRALLPRTS